LQRWLRKIWSKNSYFLEFLEFLEFSTFKIFQIIYEFSPQKKGATLKHHPLQRVHRSFPCFRTEIRTEIRGGGGFGGGFCFCFGCFGCLCFSGFGGFGGFACAKKAMARDECEIW
jgi:hypothetical protein